MAESDFGTRPGSLTIDFRKGGNNATQRGQYQEHTGELDMHLEPECELSSFGDGDGRQYVLFKLRVVCRWQKAQSHSPDHTQKESEYPNAN